MEAEGESFELAVGHLVEGSDGCEELYVGGGELAYGPYFAP